MDEFCVSLTGIAKCNERIKLSIDKIKSLCTFRASLTPRPSLRNRYIRQGKIPAIFGVHGIIRAISGFIMHRAVTHSFKISVFEFSPMVLKFVGE